MVLVGLSLTACSNDDLDTNQYQGGVSLNAYGPNPVMRGGQLRFVGSNLDQVASIAIPGVGAITNFETVKAGVPSEIRVTVPKDGPTVGRVVLTANNGQTFETRTATEIEQHRFRGVGGMVRGDKIVKVCHEFRKPVVAQFPSDHLHRISRILLNSQCVKFADK